MLRGLKSRRVVLPQGVLPASVLIDAGRVARVEVGGQAEEPGVEDLGDLVVAPGLVDCHVHLNEPGRTEWEGFETGTRAAAAGGVTTLVDMPLNCLPVTTTRAAFDTKLAHVAGKLHVDVGFWGGVVPGNAEELTKLAEAGVLGCKTFLVHSGIDEFPNSSEADLRAAMPVLKRAGLPLLAHAELDLGAPGAASDPAHYHGYLASRPRRWEDEAIALLVRLCRETGCAVHIVHLSSATAVPILRDAKAEGLPITVETCPHYLCFEAEQIPHGATHYKCAPPIRERDNREALWRALLDGVIDFVITDHSPCTPQLKQLERGDFMDAWGGIASLQLGLPAVWTEAAQRGATLAQVVRWMSEAPARFAGLGQRKGRLEAGYDADLIVWDPDAEHVVQADDLHFKHKLSPYLGRRLRGKLHRSYVRGQLAYDARGHSQPPVGQPLLFRQERA